MLAAVAGHIYPFSSVSKAEKALQPLGASLAFHFGRDSLFGNLDRYRLRHSIRLSASITAAGMSFVVAFVLNSAHVFV